MFTEIHAKALCGSAKSHEVGASDPTDAHENPSVKKAKGERKTDKKKSLRRL